MKRAFQLSDISALSDCYKFSSVAHDRLMKFLEKFKFNNIYQTDDDSVVYIGKDIEIEIFNIEYPIKRKISIMCWDGGIPTIFEL